MPSSRLLPAEPTRRQAIVEPFRIFLPFLDEAQAKIKPITMGELMLNSTGSTVSWKEKSSQLSRHVTGNLNASFSPHTGCGLCLLCCPTMIVFPVFCPHLGQYFLLCVLWCTLPHWLWLWITLQNHAKTVSVWVNISIKTVHFTICIPL